MAYYGLIPNWFYGVDSLFEVFSLVVALLIALFSYRVYQHTKQRNQFYFSVAFLTLGFSYLFKVVSNIMVYREVPETVELGIVSVQSFLLEQVAWSVTLKTIMYPLYKLLFLMALTLLLLSVAGAMKRRYYPMYFYFIFVSAVSSIHEDIVFYIISTVLLGLIAFYYYLNFLKNKTRNKRWVMYSFFILAFSGLMIALIEFSGWLYVLGEFLQLVAYLILLMVFIGIIKKNG